MGMLLNDPRTTIANAADVLRIYETVRLPFARAVVQNAAKVGRMYEFNYPGLYDGIDTEDVEETKRRLRELEGAIKDLWQWQWKEPVQEQWTEAARLLDGVLGAEEKAEAKEAGTKKAWKWCCVM